MTVSFTPDEFTVYIITNLRSEKVLMSPGIILTEEEKVPQKIWQVMNSMENFGHNLNQSRIELNYV